MRSLQLYHCTSASDEVLETLAANCPKLKQLEIIGDLIGTAKITQKGMKKPSPVPFIPSPSLPYLLLGYLALVNKGIDAVNIPLSQSESSLGVIPELHRWGAITIL